MDRDEIVTMLNTGVRSYENAMQDKIANDIEQLFEENKDIERDLKGLVTTLFRLEQMYEQEFNDFLDEWMENPPMSSLREARFAETSTAFMPKVFVTETIEQLNKDYTFEEIYEKDMYYAELLLYLEKEQAKRVPKGYFFKFTESSTNELPGKNVYVFVDEEDVTFGDICEVATLRFDPTYFECTLIPLEYLPEEGEPFVYLRMSDISTIELS